MLTVYHGSTCQVETPLAGVCRPNLDFRIGFYVTDLKEQASRWALRTAEIRHEENVWLNIYTLDMDSCLHASYRYLHFETYNAEWLKFVVACRQGSTRWQNYDIIEGGIADDRVIRTIDLYMRGDYTHEEALSRLIHQEPNNQICIINQKIIDEHLHFIEAVPLTLPSPTNKGITQTDIVMQGKYYGIVEQLAIRLNISDNQALDIFYNSDLYQRIIHRIGDLYLMSDAYIVDELIRELQKKQG